MTHLSVLAHEPSGKNAFGPLGTLPVRIPLYDADQRPTWLEHPTMFTDVVAIPVETVRKGAIQIVVSSRETTRIATEDPTWHAFPPINAYSDDVVLPDAHPEVGQVAFVVGFPFGDKSPTRPAPIWKAATIASELRYPWRSRPDGAASVAPEPFFFIDTASGMSGAPVVREWMTADGPRTRVVSGASGALRLVGSAHRVPARGLQKKERGSRFGFHPVVVPTAQVASWSIGLGGGW